MHVGFVDFSFMTDSGPFDVIGDVHGCYPELLALLEQLGWRDLSNYTSSGVGYNSDSDLRKVVFLGDLTDRGPSSVGVLRLVMGMVEAGHAICLRGNHDDKLMRKLAGHKVRVGNGLETTLAELRAEPPHFVARVRHFLQALVNYQVLDGGRLVVAHAGIKEHMIGEHNDRVQAFTMYGDTTGEVDDLGFPVRRDWAADYHGDALVVYGHSPVTEPRWLHNTVNIDTGCVFGGKLTALRYPERASVSVPAEQTYYSRAGFGS